MADPSAASHEPRVVLAVLVLVLVLVPTSTSTQQRSTVNVEREQAGKGSRTVSPTEEKQQIRYCSCTVLKMFKSDRDKRIG